MVSRKSQLLWLEKQPQQKKLGKNRGILKPSWAFVKTKRSEIVHYVPAKVSGAFQNVQNLKPLDLKIDRPATQGLVDWVDHQRLNHSFVPVKVLLLVL